MCGVAERGGWPEIGCLTYENGCGRGFVTYSTGSPPAFAGYPPPMDSLTLLSRPCTIYLFVEL